MSCEVVLWPEGSQLNSVTVKKCSDSDYMFCLFCSSFGFMFSLVTNINQPTLTFAASAQRDGRCRQVSAQINSFRSQRSHR